MTFQSDYTINPEPRESSRANKVHGIDLVKEDDGSSVLALQVNIEGRAQTVLLAVDDIPMSDLSNQAEVDQEMVNEIRQLREKIGLLHIGLGVSFPNLIHAVEKLSIALSQDRNH